MRSLLQNPLVNPSTESWLKEHHYDFKSEVQMPISGRADYVAFHKKTGKCLIIECKSSALSLARAIGQVLDYCSQYQFGATPALAIPIHHITDKHRSVCMRRNVMLIELDVPESDDRIESDAQQRFENEYLSITCAVIDKFRRFPVITINEILEFHGSHTTNPIRDLVCAAKSAMLASKSINLDIEPRLDSVKVNRVNKAYMEAIRDFDPAYTSLRDYVEFSQYAAESRNEKIDSLYSSVLRAQGFVSNGQYESILWEAEKYAEFHCMADMIHAFNYDDATCSYSDDNGNFVSDDLNYPGSAHSFTRADEWREYHKATHPSYIIECLDSKMLKRGYTSDELAQRLVATGGAR